MNFPPQPILMVKPVVSLQYVGNQFVYWNDNKESVIPDILYTFLLFISEYSGTVESIEQPIWHLFVSSKIRDKKYIN